MTSAATRGAPPWERDPLVQDLVDTLTSERRRLAELRVALADQRDAIAADDVTRIDETVFAAQRVLLTLNEARAHRRVLCERLGCGDQPVLWDMVDALGQKASPALRLAVTSLEEEARALARESAINREVLRHQLAATSAHVRMLATAGEPECGYGERTGAAAPGAARFLSRQV